MITYVTVEYIDQLFLLLLPSLILCLLCNQVWPHFIGSFMLQLVHCIHLNVFLI